MSFEKLLLLAIAWIVWCSIHSIMIAKSFLVFCENRLPGLCKYHRLIFNLVSTISLVLVYVYSQTLPATPQFEFIGIWNILRISVLILGIAIFIGGTLNYDLMHFIGLHQIISNDNHRVLTKSGSFKADGLLNVTRHPWYLAAYLLIWSSAKILTDVDLIIRLVLSLYLVIGTLLEERKLIWQFGDEYRKYQKDVSMIIPFKWILNFLKK